VQHLGDEYLWIVLHEGKDVRNLPVGALHNFKISSAAFSLAFGQNGIQLIFKAHDLTQGPLIALRP